MEEGHLSILWGENIKHPDALWIATFLFATLETRIWGESNLAVACGIVTENNIVTSHKRWT